MSYARSLSGWQSDIFEQYKAGELGPCLKQANALPQVMAIENTIENLARTWKPTGFFRPAEVQQALTMLHDAAVESGKAVASVGRGMLDIEDVRTLKAQAIEDLNRQVVDASKPYQKAVADAKASGVNVINAPNFKNFVISAMQSIANGYVAATMIDCIAGGLLRFLNTFYNAVAAIAAFVSKMVDVVVRVGEAVIDAAGTAFDLAATIIKFAPYVGAAIVAYIGYTWIRRAAAEGPSATYARVSQGSAAKQLP